MMQFDRISLGRQAKELGFVRDTFEKVCRLTDVLSFMERDSLLSDTSLKCPCYCANACRNDIIMVDRQLVT